MESPRDTGPQSPGNIREHLPELEAEGYHIAFCVHCNADPSRRDAAWKTLDSTGFKVVLVGCIKCYRAELQTAAQAALALFLSGG